MKSSYSEMIELSTRKERFEYLALGSKPGRETFASMRCFNQRFYRSKEWRDVCRHAVFRDNGFDMALDGYPIGGRTIVHHINPLTPEQIEEHDVSALFDLDNLVCVSFNTHQAIHYGDYDLIDSDPIVRKPFDQCPWR